MPKHPQVHPEDDLFAPRVNDLPLKDQQELMQRPFFSLSKRKRNKPIEYRSPDGEHWIRVSGNPAFGIATIWDLDILIWATSCINRQREKGVNDLSRTIQTTPYEILRGIRRDIGGNAYRDLQASLQRLQSTTIETSLRAPKRRTHSQFAWLDEYRLESDPVSGAPRGVSLVLSNWVFEGLLADRSLLTLHPDYFSLTGGIERAIYRIARKHAGDQPQGWLCRVSILHEKTGSDSPLKHFNYMLKGIVEANALPDYDMAYENAGDGSPAVRFLRRGAVERAAIKADLERLARAEDRRRQEDARAAEVDRRMEKRSGRPLAVDADDAEEVLGD